MAEKTVNQSFAKKANRLLSMAIVFSLLMTLPFSTVPAYGKYVLDPIIDITSFQSTGTYTVTSIGAITGTPQIGKTLTAGPLSPSNATVNYQWQRSDEPAGTYTDIDGATLRTYTLTADDRDCYIKVRATGRENYTGLVTSDFSGPVTAIPITAIGVISGTAQVGKILTVGTLSPSGATVTYQWLRDDDGDGTFETISGATSQTYKLTANDLYCNIKVSVAGTGSYTGTQTSASKGPVAKGVITAIGVISGTATVGNTLTAGSLTPNGATATYQWQRSSVTSDFTDIDGATSSSYTLTGSDNFCYVRVIATGSNAYTGVVTSDYVGKVSIFTTELTSIGAIGGIAEVGQVLTAGTLSPNGATATYQWQRAIPGGAYVNIDGETGNSYTLTSADKDKYIRVQAIGSSTFTGTVTSPSKGPVGPGHLTAIGPIGGTAVIGETLTAGTLTPVTATVTYQWQRCENTNGTYTNIAGATSSAYALTESDEGYFIKVVATGTGDFAGEAVSDYVGPVGVTAVTVNSIDAISGNPAVLETLTAGTVHPAGASVTYQWLRCDTATGEYESIPGATSSTYSLTAEDLGYYIKVQATGSSTCTGTVISDYKGPVVKCVITAIGPISGTASSGETLTVGTLTPFGATATYQWQRANLIGDTFSDIIGGTSSSYTLTGLDSYCYIRVVATGCGACTGTAISDYVGRVSSFPTEITSIGTINGNAEVGRILSAGTLTPAGTATYQWQRCDTADGTYENIPGATSSSYIITASDQNKFLRVVATGSSNYTGSVTSECVGPVAAGHVSAIGAISGTTAIGEILTAGTLTPATATVTYQWQRCQTTNGNYENILNANARSYTLTDQDEGYFIKVTVTGTGAFEGSVTSAYTGPVSVNSVSINSIGAISGTAAVFQILTAGTVNPAGASVTYQWLRADEADGTYEIIPGATSKTYTLTTDEYNHYIKVQANGAGTYTGSVTSSSKGRVAAGQITAIGAVSGTTSVGQTLSVGTLTPYGATATYQWQKSDVIGTTFSDIVGGTSSTYTLTGLDSFCYIRVVATGYGACTGTAISDYVGRVKLSATEITAIGAINGTAEVGQVLTAGTLTPSGTATYQWQRCATASGTYESIAGATANAYTLTGADMNKYLRLVATGSSNYTGTVISDPFGPIAAGRITAIGAIGGMTTVGQALTAGTLTPATATAAYQWKRCGTTTGTYTDIPNANADSYILTAADEGCFIKVAVTGTGVFTGSAISAYTGPVSVSTTPVTAIGAITGTLQVSKILTAGIISPGAATVTYQWLRADSENGEYENIPGATSSTCTLTTTELNHFIKVQVSGSGNYSGTAISSAKGPVTAGQLTAISSIIGTTAPGQTLVAGTLTPNGATATYQWQRSTSSSSDSFSDIVGGTSITYSLTTMDNWNYMRVKATGTGAYMGTVISDYVGRVASATIELTSIGAITGTAEAGQTLTAGTVSPANATVTYQWQRCTDANGTYESIPGAVSKTYTLSDTDVAKYIRVVAAGSNNYIGSVTSDAKGPVSTAQLTGIGPISGSTAVGETLTAGTLTPANATADYQWTRCTETNGTYENITNANGKNYTLTAGDAGYYIKVMATGTGAYAGSVTSAYTGPVSVSTTPIASIGDITGTLRVAGVLTAGKVSPTGATVTYQWYRADDAEGDYELIQGATAKTYTLTATDKSKCIKVIAIGSGTYSGSAVSTVKGPVEAGQITSISNVIGTTAAGQILSAGTVTPYGATVSYQWQHAYSTPDVFTNISGATANTYALTASENQYYIRVVATGIGSFTGSAISNYVGKVIGTTVTLTSIGNIKGTAAVGQVLTAGTLTPVGTATYQWQRSTAVDGEYVNIPGATASTYTLTEADKDKFIKVVATGSNSYIGTVVSAAKGAVAAGAITGIGAITGTTTVGDMLFAGAVTPINATVVYQWQRCETADGEYIDIPNANGATYTLTSSDSGCYIRVSAEGTGAYMGEAVSSCSGPVGTTTTPINAIGAITGTEQVSRILTAGTLDPVDATATYQWLRAGADNVYEEIPGATSSTYRLTAGDLGYNIKVTAIGSGLFSGSVTSESVGEVAACPITGISNIVGTATAGQTLTAGTLSPLGATVSYQWQYSSYSDGPYYDLNGEISNTLYLTTSINGKYIRVEVTGTGGYTGTVASAATGPVVKKTTAITSLGAISGTAEIGETLTAGSISPSGATVTYQWEYRTDPDEEYTEITGATSSSYTISESDGGKYIRVTVIGSGSYIGTIASDCVGPVPVVLGMSLMMAMMPESAPITEIGAVIGTACVDQTLEAGAMTPSDAVVTYQWQRGDTVDGIYTDIFGATTNTYTLTSDDYNYFIRVAATDDFDNTVFSEPTGRIEAAAVQEPIVEEIVETGAGDTAGTTGGGIVTEEIVGDEADETGTDTSTAGTGNEAGTGADASNSETPTGTEGAGDDQTNTTGEGTGNEAGAGADDSNSETPTGIEGAGDTGSTTDTSTGVEGTGDAGSDETVTGTESAGSTTVTSTDNTAGGDATGDTTGDPTRNDQTGPTGTGSETEEAE